MDTNQQAPGVSADANAPGWKWMPDQGVYLWWDGERYTGRADWDGTQWQVGPVRSFAPGGTETAPASSRARLLMAAFVAVGCAVLFWGGYVYGQNPASHYSVDMSDYYCADENIDLIAEGLWVPWFVLVVIGGAIVTAWRRLGPHDRWLRIPAICASTALVLTCPIVQVFVQSANCAT